VLVLVRRWVGRKDSVYRNDAIVWATTKVMRLVA